VDRLPDIPVGLRTPGFTEAWAEWVGHRREIRNKLTPRTAKVQLARCEKWGEQRAIAAILHSIGQGWIGLYEPNEREQGKGADELTPADKTMIEERYREAKARERKTA
jgi:hypothetical protein